MKNNLSIVVTERIEQKILFIRNKKVILDRDLACLYKTDTRALNQAVKRNMKRFPSDFMFQLTKPELGEVITNCDNLRPLKYAPNLPFAFTEQGVAMLSSVIKSERAIAINIHIMRVFTRLRELMLKHQDLDQRITALEKKYNRKFKNIFEAIRQLLEPPLPPPKPKFPIGFHAFMPADNEKRQARTRTCLSKKAPPGIKKACK
jgi:hypothetical protein